MQCKIILLEAWFADVIIYELIKKMLSSEINIHCFRHCFISSNIFNLLEPSDSFSCRFKYVIPTGVQ